MKKDKCVRCQIEIDEGKYFCNSCSEVMRISPAVENSRYRVVPPPSPGFRPYTPNNIVELPDLCSPNMRGEIVAFMLEKGISSSYFQEVMIGLQLRNGSEYMYNNGNFFLSRNSNGLLGKYSISTNQEIGNLGNTVITIS